MKGSRGKGSRGVGVHRGRVGAGEAVGRPSADRPPSPGRRIEADAWGATPEAPAQPVVGQRPAMSRRSARRGETGTVPGDHPPARAVAWARAPATSANLGPGFDCLGMALPRWELWAWLTAAEADPERWSCPEHQVRWNLHGRGPAAAPPEENLVVRAICAAFARAGQAHPPAWRLAIRSTIPPARGLGSSAAAIVAGLAVANQWLRRAGRPLTPGELLQLAADLEGHADNVAAALLGGVVLAWREADAAQRWRATSLMLANRWLAVLAIPAVSGYTHEARGALPATVSHGDAAFNVARVGLLVAALTAGRGELLRQAMEDRLHQPYRMRLFPWLSTLIQRALAAGADGACLSGAGPSVLALVRPERARGVARALASGLAAAGIDGRVVLCPVGGPGCRSGLVVRRAARRPPGDRRAPSRGDDFVPESQGLAAGLACLDGPAAARVTGPA